MKTEWKWRAYLGAILGLALSQGALAAPSDSLTVTITPNAGYAVDVDTTGVVLNLGTIDLGNSTQTVKPATVTVQSSLSQTDLTLTGAMVSGGWTFDANTATNETDALKAWAVFTDTSVAAAPTQGAGGAFSGTVPDATGSDVVSTSAIDVGTAANSDLQMVLTSGTAGYKTMEDLPPSGVDLPASRSHLWLYFTLPPATTNATAKEIQFTVTAVAPN
jgi:hypothetical protein